jgi:hypothetical protein
MGLVSDGARAAGAFIVLSRVLLCDAPETRMNRAGGFQSIDKIVYFVEREARRCPFVSILEVLTTE